MALSRAAVGRLGIRSPDGVPKGHGACRPELRGLREFPRDECRSLGRIWVAARLRRLPPVDGCRALAAPCGASAGRRAGSAGPGPPRSTSIGAGPSRGRLRMSGAPVAPSMPAIVEPCVRRANPHGCGAAESGGVLSSTETCPTPRPAPSRFLARRPFVHLRKLMVSTAALSDSRSGPGPRRPAGLRPRCDGRRDCAGCCGGWPRYSWRPHRWRCTARCDHLARGRKFAIQDGCLARFQL